MIDVLHIAPGLNVKGGITTVLHGYIQSCLCNNIRLHFIASHRDGSIGFKIAVAVVGLYKTFLKMASGQIDIVHLHCGDKPSPLRKYFYYRLVRLFNTKVVLHFHGSGFIDQYQKFPHFLKKRCTYLFTEVDLLICLSVYWEKQILNIFPTAKTKVVRNAIAIPDQCTPRINSKRPLRLAFLGRIIERKGLFDLIEVIAGMKSQGIDVYLEIGGDGDVDNLNRMIQGLGLSNQVKYLGWIGTKDKERLFGRVDAYVLPSYAEGMPMSVLEAMAYGLPVVSTKVGGVPDLVCDEKTGFLIVPGDKVSLSKSIKRLVMEPDLIRRFGEKGREKAIECHQLESMMKRLMQLYQDLID